MDDIGADRRFRLLDPLLELLQERVDHLRPRLSLIEIPPAVAGLDIPLTVFGSCPVKVAADQTVPVRSYASRISMISLPDFATGPLQPPS
ncbi:hypothetical protein [Streptomyces lydicus]